MMYHNKLNVKDCQDFFSNLQETTAKKITDFRKLPSSDNGIYSDILKRDIFENAQIHKIKFPTSVLVTNTYLKHPATVVYVDRGKDTCTAVFGESFSYGDSMASPFRDVPIHWLLNESTMRHKMNFDVFDNMDVFENFRNTCISYYDLDPANYLTSPSLAWDAMLKMTNIELEQISDIKILNIIERQKRGGLCFVGSKRHIEANNEYLENYDDKKDSNYLMYFCTK